jgi:hypothetical protein
LLGRLGIDARGFLALLRALVLMDLREQHYAQATASKPHYAISPLFLVVGQCLTVSALTCGFLFARVDVFFFAFVNLSLSLLLLAAAVVVEFGEVALNPIDLEVIGHRPVAPRTYAAARLANLLFYFVLMFVSLNLLPLLVGAGLRDAGWWYAPAYLIVSLAAHLVVLALLVVLLSLADAASLHGLKQVLSWTQIIAIMVVFYGGQLMLRDGEASLQVWGAFPPPWTDYLPVTWLARLVERAATAPDLALLGPFAGCLAIAGLSCLVALAWLERLCRRMQPVEQAGEVAWAMPASQIGSLAGRGARWLTFSAAERVGYWLTLTFLRRDAGLAMRCLFAFQVAVAALVVGIAAGQFANPCRESSPAATTLPLVVVFSLPLGAPGLVFNLTYCRDSAGGWLLHAAPLDRPFDLAWGACKAAMLWVVTPLCLAVAVACAVVWGDILAALLHGLLAWSLTWVMLLASLWLVLPAWPFSLPPPRGVGLALPPLPTLALGLSLAVLGVVHGLLARYPAYWIVLFAALFPAGRFFRHLARRRLLQLGVSS